MIKAFPSPILSDLSVSSCRFSDNVKITGNLDISGSVIVEILEAELGTFDEVIVTGTTNSTSTVTGALIVGGGVGIAIDVNIDGVVNIDGAVSITDITDSVDSTTGALIVAGGVGIAKDINTDGAVILSTKTVNLSSSKSGLATLVPTTGGSTVTVSTNVVLEVGETIFLSRLGTDNLAGAADVGNLAVDITATGPAGTASFTVTSTSETDEGTVIWFVVKGSFTPPPPIFTQQGAKLIGTGYTGNANQGWSTALSADGNTLAIGGPSIGVGDSKGGVWIYTRTGSVWSQEGAYLYPSDDTVEGSQVGTAISLSADGNTLAVGGSFNLGFTWVFTRSMGVWSQQGLRLHGTGSGEELAQGTSVSLSADGDTLAIGGPYDVVTSIGGTWIFTRTMGVWTQQGLKLVGSGYIGESNQGYSVALTSDGNTLAIGGLGDNNYIGATWIYTRTGSVWTQQGSKLVGTGYVGTDIEQGTGVAIQGNTLIVGGIADNNYIGATWVFTRSGSTWTQVGDKLVGTGYIGTDIEQGSSLAINGDENIIVTSGPFDNDAGVGPGASWVFQLLDGVWTQTQKLVVTGSVNYSQVGRYKGTAISYDGSTIAIGGQTDGPYVGATWIFTS